MFCPCSIGRMQPLRLHDVPFELVPHEVRLLMITAPAGFPSPAADDLEEPIDLGSWLIQHPAASYVMRVAGESMTGAGINDGDYIVVSRSEAPKPGHKRPGMASDMAAFRQ